MLIHTTYPATPSLWLSDTATQTPPSDNPLTFARFVDAPGAVSVADAQKAASPFGLEIFALHRADALRTALSELGTGPDAAEQKAELLEGYLVRGEADIRRVTENYITKADDSPVVALREFISYGRRAGHPLAAQIATRQEAMIGLKEAAGMFRDAAETLQQSPSTRSKTLESYHFGMAEIAETVARELAMEIQTLRDQILEDSRRKAEQPPDQSRSS